MMVIDDGDDRYKTKTETDSPEKLTFFLHIFKYEIPINLDFQNEIKRNHV